MQKLFPTAFLATSRVHRCWLWDCW